MLLCLDNDIPDNFYFSGTFHLFFFPQGFIPVKFIEHNNH